MYLWIIPKDITLQIRNMKLNWEKVHIFLDPLERINERT